MNSKGRSGQSCADCLYYISGACHRYQPLQVPGKSVWPSVSPADWCGEWEPDMILQKQHAVEWSRAYASVIRKYEPREAEHYEELADEAQRELEAMIG